MASPPGGDTCRSSTVVIPAYDAVNLTPATQSLTNVMLRLYNRAPAVSTVSAGRIYQILKTVYLAQIWNQLIIGDQFPASAGPAVASASGEYTW